MKGTLSAPDTVVETATEKPKLIAGPGENGLLECSDQPWISNKLLEDPTNKTVSLPVKELGNLSY